MFRKFKESPYARASIMLLITGGLLIVFHSWVSSTHFSVGFETINRTLAPIYFGVIFAFILCPVYNGCVRWLYSSMLEGAKRKGFSIGAALVHNRTEELTVDANEKRRILNAARAVATLVCVVLVVGLAGMLFYFVVPQVVQNVIGLINTLPQRLETLSEWTSTHLSRFPVLTVWVDSIANAGTKDIIKWVQEHVLTGNAMSIATMISNGVLAAVKYIANAFVGLLIMVYLLNYKERLFAICRKIVAATCGQKRQNMLYEFTDIVNETFIGFIVGRIIDSFIIGILTYTVLKVCGIHFALMISVIVGITNVIPFFGPFIGAIPSVFILMLEEPMQALYFIIIILVIQQLDGNVIGPNIVGNAIGISSFWVLIAVLVGGGLFGFAGMALGVPVFAVLYRYADKMTVKSLKNRKRQTATADYFSLEQFGINDEEVSLEPKRKQASLFRRLRKNSTVNKDLHKDSREISDDVDAEIKEMLAKGRPAGEPKRSTPKIRSYIDGDSKRD